MKELASVLLATAITMIITATYNCVAVREILTMKESYVGGAILLLAMVDIMLPILIWAALLYLCWRISNHR